MDDSLSKGHVMFRMSVLPSAAHLSHVPPVALAGESEAGDSGVAQVGSGRLPESLSVGVRQGLRGGLPQVVPGLVQGQVHLNTGGAFIPSLTSLKFLLQLKIGLYSIARLSVKYIRESRPQKFGELIRHHLVDEVGQTSRFVGENISGLSYRQVHTQRFHVGADHQEVV